MKAFISLFGIALALSACGKGGGDTAAPKGSAATATPITATVAAATTATEPAVHCMKAKLGKCEETTAGKLAAAKAQLLSTGTPDQKKMAEMLSIDAFKAFCSGEGKTLGEGSCPTANRVGSCEGPTGTDYYYSGADGYTAEDFVFECGKDFTPHAADGKVQAKPASARMSCMQSKSKTCVEDENTGKLSRSLFCKEDAFVGPVVFAPGPCPTEKRVGGCKEADITIPGQTIVATKVTYSYDAKNAKKDKSMCAMMKGTWTDVAAPSGAAAPKKGK